MSTAVSPERHPAQQHRDGLPPHPAYRRHNNDDVGLDPVNHSQGPLSSSNTQPGYMSDHPINVSRKSHFPLIKTSPFRFIAEFVLCPPYLFL